MKQEILDKISVGFQQAIDPYLIETDIKFLDHIKDRMVLDIRGYLWGKNLPNKTIKYPKDWWQAFKERWFTPALKEAYPVEYTEIELSSKVLYPDFKPYMPPGAQECRFLIEESLFSRNYKCSFEDEV